jgi:D-alanine-D-alanine ligase
MQVAILYNEVTEDPAYDSQLQEEPLFPIADAIERLGHVQSRIACTLDLVNVREQIRQIQPQVVFNRVESLGGSDQLAGAITLLLDAMQIPYTGSRTSALMTTSDKLTTKKRLRWAGLPTPQWWTADSPTACDKTSNRPRQVIFKAVLEHASFKMDDSAVLAISDLGEIRGQIRERAASSNRPFFAEDFITGREFNLSILAGLKGPRVLPPAEIDFSAFPDGKPRIVGFDAKWNAGCFEFEYTPRRFDFPRDDEELLKRLTELSLECWNLFELRGYARVDFRVDDDNRPWILEVNANPSLAPDAGFAAALTRAEISYDQAIQAILDDALRLNYD